MRLKNMTKFWRWFHVASFGGVVGLTIWAISANEYVAIPIFIAYAVSQVKHWMW